MGGGAWEASSKAINLLWLRGALDHGWLWTGLLISGSSQVRAGHRWWSILGLAVGGHSGLGVLGELFPGRWFAGVDDRVLRIAVVVVLVGWVGSVVHLCRLPSCGGVRRSACITGSGETDYDGACQDQGACCERAGEQCFAQATSSSVGAFSVVRALVPGQGGGGKAPPWAWTVNGS